MNVAAQTTTSVHHFLSIAVSLLVASLASGRFVDRIPRRPFAAWSMIAGRRAAQ
jgi:hypothetical protein